MNSEDFVIDYTEENKPQKPPMSAKTKKKLIYILCAVLGVAIALLGIYFFDLAFTGAVSPEKAIAEYITAHNLYDIDGIIEYSAPCNKNRLFDNRETSDRFLRSYLKKSYEGLSPKYTESEISVAFISKIEFTPDTKTFKDQMVEYEKLAKGESEKVKKTAIVSMQVTTGDLVTTQDYLAVKIGARWYYAGTASSF